MYFVHLAPLITPIFLVLPSVGAWGKRAMQPVKRASLPSSWMDKCHHNCTTNRREHIKCQIDCPPMFDATGTEPQSPFPTSFNNGPSNFSEDSDYSVKTVTETITTIPAYCLPGGPAAPKANVPTTSLSNYPALLSAISLAVEEEAHTTAAINNTRIYIPNIPAPAVPTGILASAGVSPIGGPSNLGPGVAGGSANETTSVKYTTGPIPTQTEEPQPEESPAESTETTDESQAAQTTVGDIPQAGAAAMPKMVEKAFWKLALGFWVGFLTVRF